METKFKAQQHQQHAIIVPFPAQGHINPMLQLAKLLHSNYGFYITFVNSTCNHNRLINSHGQGYLHGLPRFRFESIPDGLSGPANGVGTAGSQSIEALCRATTSTCVEPFRDLVAQLNCEGTGPPATCIVADGVMSFTMKVAEEFGIPEVAFWTMSACGFMGYFHFPRLIDNGLVPLRDTSYIRNGYLDTQVNCLPGISNTRLKDLPSFIRTTDPNDFMLNFMTKEIEVTSKASAIILNTFEVVELEVLNALSSMQKLPHIYTIGPLDLLVDQIPDKDPIKSIATNVWNEQSDCMDWLDSQKPDSVVYVNFGSVIVMTMEQFTEFAWGLANSKKPFLWVIRPDLMKNNDAYSLFTSQEFMTEIKDRSLMVSWCPQKEVLKHKSIGGFLTHNGWNSTLESIGRGVPMICKPFGAEQEMNCRYCCVEWKIGMEIDGDVNRGDVEKLIRALMEEEKGKEMKRRARQWEREAQKAINPKGSSKINLDTLVSQVLVKN